MKIETLTLEGFRNIKEANLNFHEGVNIIYGGNGQGKTNLLESIWLFTGNKSFRGARDSETVGFGREYARLGISFFSQERKQEAAMTLTQTRSVTVNGVPDADPAALSGKFSAVVFSPDHLSLIKAGPEERRRFLDTAITGVFPRYRTKIAEYRRLLTQRNALLKDIPAHAELMDTLEVWDIHLARLAKGIFEARRKYCLRLSEKTAEIYAGISKGKEHLEIRYASCQGGGIETSDEYEAALRKALRETLPADMAAGHTAAGPHRDNLDIDIGGYPARNFGSQGQQRSAVLSLKMAEASLLQEITGEAPAALLDDVMSELDTARQDYILHHIKGWQVLMTCCDPAPLMRLSGGKIFCVENGVIEEGDVSYEK